MCSYVQTQPPTLLLTLDWKSGGLGSRSCPFLGLSFFFCILGFTISALLRCLRSGVKQGVSERWTRKGFAMGKLFLGMKCG